MLILLVMAQQQQLIGCSLCRVRPSKFRCEHFGTELPFCSEACSQILHETVQPIGPHITKNTDGTVTLELDDKTYSCTEQEAAKKSLERYASHVDKAIEEEEGPEEITPFFPLYEDEWEEVGGVPSRLRSHVRPRRSDKKRKVVPDIVDAQTWITMPIESRMEMLTGMALPAIAKRIEASSNVIPLTDAAGKPIQPLNPAHKGRLTRWAQRHGYSTKHGVPMKAIHAAEHAKSGHVRKEAVFAEVSRHWHHDGHH